MEFFTVGTVAKIGLELFLGVCIKLFCDNGRVHWRDFLNDFVYALPGFTQQSGDGLTRQVEAMVPAAPVLHESVDHAAALAAK